MNWILTLYENEIVPSCKKDSAIVLTVKAKCDKLKEELKDVSKKLKDLTNKCSSLDASNKQLLAYRSGTSTKRKRVKSWPEYSIQYKRKKIKHLSKSIDGVLTDSEFTYKHIELCNSDTGQMVSIDNTGPKPVLDFKSALNNSKDSLVKKNLYIKEKYNISNEAYHEISMTNSYLPSLQKEVKQINSEYIIEAVPGTAIGVQQSLQKKLTERLQHIVSCDPSLQRIKKIQVKITGDGTYVSRSMHILVIAFTIVNVLGEEFPNSPRGNHVLALINTTEDYEHLEDAVSELAAEIQKTNAIKINDTTFEIEYFLSGDWKFLAICLGIKAANACYSCIWCKCPIMDRYDLSKKWSISDVSKNARTIEEIQSLSKLANKRNVEMFGCV